MNFKRRMERLESFAAEVERERRHAASLPVEERVRAARNSGTGVSIFEEID